MEWLYRYYLYVSGSQLPKAVHEEGDLTKSTAITACDIGNKILSADGYFSTLLPIYLPYLSIHFSYRRKR